MKKRVQGQIDGAVFDEFKTMCAKEGISQAEGYEIALTHFLDDLHEDQQRAVFRTKKRR